MFGLYCCLFLLISEQFQILNAFPPQYERDHSTRYAWYGYIIWKAWVPLPHTYLHCVVIILGLPIFDCIVNILFKFINVMNDISIFDNLYGFIYFTIYHILGFS